MGERRGKVERGMMMKERWEEEDTSKRRERGGKDKGIDVRGKGVRGEERMREMERR